MALFVHVTQRCEEEAASAGWQGDLEKLKNKIEEAQELLGFQHFPKPYRVKKQWPRYNARLITSVYPVGEHDVACFLSILTKADPSYDQFQNDPVGFGQSNFDGLFSDKDLHRIVAERTAKSPPAPKLQPTESEYTFLFRASGGVELGRNENDLICETPAWVAKVSMSPVKDRLTEFYRALDKLKPDQDFVQLSDRPGWGIFYAQHPNLRPNLRITILLEPVCGDADKQLSLLRQKYAPLLRGNSEVTEELLLRHCQRAYPDYLRCGEDEWLEVQKDAVANIALSHEETKVLEASRQGKGAFPLFINGRAGSGKSTLLQYIFTEHLHRYFTQGQDTGFKPPLYLTCSPELLQHSRTVVEKLLRCNASFLSEGEPFRLEQAHRPVIEMAFQEFRPFLLSHLPIKERRHFQNNNRVDYSQFRKLWEQKFGNDADAHKRFGPDISWHVIRTYIKGMSSESYQDPDEYRQFDENERQVTDEVFRLVYERVWERWYRPLYEDHARWDDQDLARRLIEGEFIKPERPAIFCDEAQDFTRLELEIILRLCLFSNRAVAPYDISRIPLVFAGDPFQTINPTGFRWEATKAAFVEKFILSLDPNRRSAMDDLNYCELTYNYRSSRRIVEFSNMVQAMRCSLFDLRRVKPQEPWANEHASPPIVWFDSDDAKFWERLRQQKNVTLVVPCGDGEEQEFVKKHLNKWLRIDENGVAIDVSVFSAARAKGLEFDRVVVFGFGEYAQDDALEIIRTGVVQSDSNLALPLGYFINRLYVAVSRPKRRLFIVDSKAGRDHLWRFATDAKIQKEVLHGVHDAPKWEDKVTGMIEGMLEHFDTDEFTDFEEEAKNLKAQGLGLHDSYLLRSAANRYRLAGIQGEVNCCLAEALFVDGKNLDAGKAFDDCGQHQRAVDAYWRVEKGAGYKLLLEVVVGQPDLQNRLEYALAKFLVSPLDYDVGYRALTVLLERTGNTEAAVAVTSCSYWTDPVRRIVEMLIEMGEKHKEVTDWKALSALFGRLDSVGFGFKKSVRARVCYLAEEWSMAISLWEDANDRTSNEYREAKARVAPYPEQLSQLKELGKNAAILEAYAANRSFALDGEARRIVGAALLAAKRFDEAIEPFARAGGIAELAELAADALSANKKEIAERAVRLCAVLSVQQSHWDAVHEYLNNGKLPRAPIAVQKILRPLLSETKSEFDFLLAACCARSDSLTKLDDSEQKPISKFLRELNLITTWQERISVEELGAAIERSQRYIDAVEFYEKALVAGKSEAEKRFAITRWIKSKQRLAVFYVGEKQYRKADETKEEIEKVSF